MTKLCFSKELVMKDARFAIAAVVVLSGFFVGCTSVKKVGESTVSFVRGDLNIDETNFSIGKVYSATLKAFEELEITVLEKEKGELKSYVSGRDQSDDKIQVWMWRLETDKTKLKIRIGLFGDETRSWAIYDQIQSNLK